MKVLLRLKRFNVLGLTDFPLQGGGGECDGYEW